MELILSALRSFPASETVQATGLFAVAFKVRVGAARYLSSPDISEHPTLSLTDDTLGLLMHAMRAFPQSEDVSYNACACLGAFAVCSTNRLLIMSSAAFALVVSAMSQFAESEYFQEIATGILANFSCDEESIGAILDAGGLNRVVKAMRQFPNTEEVQRHSCHVFANLVDNPLARSILVQEGGIELTVSAMRLFPCLDPLQHNATYILAKLAMENDTRASILSRWHDVLPCVVNAVTCFPNSADIHSDCSALVSISMNNNVSTPTETLQLIQTKLASFPDSRKV
eukprot:GILK01018903.1.p1 GENE.GILK01018903.1~~GILK01018903.1.p1  ORF type:complete len:285 (+),score=26.66 GILK01018903.1:118-972(+)